MFPLKFEIFLFLKLLPICSEVCGEDVEELVSDHSKELTTEELQDLHLDLQPMAFVSDKEEESGENVPSSEIKSILSMWSKVKVLVVKNHPDKAVAGHVCNLFNDILIHFKETAETNLFGYIFFVRQGFTDTGSGPSSVAKVQEEKRPQIDLYISHLLTLEYFIIYYY